MPTESHPRDNLVKRRDTMNRCWHNLVLMLCIAGTSPAVVAQVYKWTDAQGQVHYGDRPSSRDDAAATQIPITPSTTAAPDHDARATKRERLLRAFEKERADKQAQVAKRNAQQLALEQQCVRLHEKIERAQTAQYIYQDTEEGERKILSHAERAQYEERLRTLAREHCT